MPTIPEMAQRKAIDNSVAVFVLGLAPIADARESTKVDNTAKTEKWINPPHLSTLRGAWS
jgi:hypothetical protein